jgi:FHA domain
MIVRKLIVSDGRTERELLLVGRIVVGRDPTCQLNDLDPLLSRRHAEFVSTARGVTIRDLRSRNGILVNGEKVPEHALKPGDMIQLGHLHLTYIEEPLVTTPEDDSRSHATTEIDLELPTLTPIDLGIDAPDFPAAMAPTTSMPVVDDLDDEATVARVAAPLAPAAVVPAKENDPDATRVSMPRAKAPASARIVAPIDDPDATRAPGMKAPAAVKGWDASIDRGTDETRLPTTRPRAADLDATRLAAPTQARVVANASLIVTEASPSCHAIIGARPETLIGGQLADAISRGLTFVAAGDGPASLSLSIARAASDQTITITFRAGQATESLS